MTEYRDSNGLVQGMIPAGQPCPFLSRCKFKVHTCPGVDGKTKGNHFSCAAARAFSLITEAEKVEPGSGRRLQMVVEKPKEIVLQIPTKRFSWGELPAVKEDDK
jgi:hypothetical protein